MLKMSVKITQNGEVVTAYLEGEIDHHSAGELRREIDEAVERDCPTMLVLDFKDVTFMDSSGIGLIMGRSKLMKECGGRLEVRNSQPYIKRVLKLSGIERIVKIT